MISRETIEKIQAAAKIEEVVSDYVTLKKRGANLIGLCPFHNEKTGSFTVSPSKGIYKCFGCGASGHVVRFIMDIEQCSYVEALKQLGRKYHIEVEDRQLTAEEQQRQDDRESMFVVNEFCNQWFQQQLWETQEGRAIGLGYFRERGLRDDIIRKFQLGYSPEKGNPLAKALKEKGFKEEYIINNVDTKMGVGVVGKSEDGHLYDRFRDRVIFPFNTLSGKTVAFAGRILKKKDNVGKYVNSPDSLIYSKTYNLFGIFQAKQAMSRQDMCYLVEGQMDVISMHQSGIENVVASGGTALTKPQIQLIKRFTSNITVLYDGDPAGIHAAVRGIDMFLEEGFNVKVVLLPDGEDPDSYAQHHDATEFIQYIQEHQTDFIRFKVALLSKDAGNDPYKLAELIKDITASIAIIPDMITRQVYIKDCADRLHISEQVLTRDVIALRKRKMAEKRKQEKQNQQEEQVVEDNVIQAADTPITPKPTNIVTKHSTRNPFEQNYYNLIQLVVRYGELPMEVDGQTYSIGEVILYTLEADGIKAPRPIYQKMADEFKAHFKEEGFKAETFFKFHPDPEISSMAVDMIAERYQLSSIYSRQSVAEHLTQQVENRPEDDLGETITQLIYEIKLNVIVSQIEQVEKELKIALQNDNWEEQKKLLVAQKELMANKNEICKRLGNRIITI